MFSEPGSCQHWSHAYTHDVCVCVCVCVCFPLCQYFFFSLSSVDTLVSLKGSQPVETHVAPNTLERLLACVGAQVSLENPQLTEDLATCFTLEGSLSCLIRELSQSL